MSALRTIALWRAGPSIGIALGLVLGTIADKPPAEIPRPVMLSVPRLGGAVARDQHLFIAVYFHFLKHNRP